ncbi:hypothetical protein DFH07DRAFT_781580 [Mycena maculata]|uniref:Protein kinase domain-containing protein n=1 Tax=Mycena maculata TaxID=230809 RepID=A0AAD7HXF7_9AGAR|nr:hypothetical protein DFH07DRAFT_781580 [Mycena maculata]
MSDPYRRPLPPYGYTGCQYDQPQYQPAPGHPRPQPQAPPTYVYSPFALGPLSGDPLQSHPGSNSFGAQSPLAPPGSRTRNVLAPTLPPTTMLGVGGDSHFAHGVTSFGGPASSSAPRPHAAPTKVRIRPFETGFRFRDLEFLALPTAKDLSTSTATAWYSENSPSPSRPCFWIHDQGLGQAVVDRFHHTIRRHCETHMRPLADCETPEACHTLWGLICDHVAAGGYRDEGFVTTYGTLIVSLVSALFRYIDGSTCTQSMPKTEHSQKGDTNIVRSSREEPTIENQLQDYLLWAQVAMAGEWKTNRVFSHHRGELNDWKVLNGGSAKDMEAIMVKVLGLHINTAETQMGTETHQQERMTGLKHPWGRAGNSNMPRARVGFVFTGAHVMVVEAWLVLATYDQFSYKVPGLAYEVVRVDSTAPGSDPTCSIIPLLIGALGIPKDHRRDPSIRGDRLAQAWHANKRDLRGLLVPMQLSPPPPPAPGHYGAGPGPGPSSHHGSPSYSHPPGGYWAGGAFYGSASGSGASSMGGGYGAYGGGGHYQGGYQLAIDLRYDLEGITTQPHPLLSISVDMLVGADVPLSLSAARSSTAVRMELELDPNFSSAGENARIFGGKLNTRDQQGVRVIFKTYPAARFDCLRREVEAYKALARLACIVPRCWALLAPSGMEWAGLLLEFAGTQLAGGDWDTAPLSAEDRRLLYYALKEVHAAGVVHRDMAPRNVVRRARGALCIVDFERAWVGHECPGEACPELSTLQSALELS